MRVLHVTIGPELPDGADMVALRRPAIAPGLEPMLHGRGTFEHRILEELEPRPGELVVNKTRAARSTRPRSSGCCSTWASRG